MAHSNCVIVVCKIIGLIGLILERAGFKKVEVCKILLMDWRSNDRNCKNII